MRDACGDALNRWTNEGGAFAPNGLVTAVASTKDQPDSTGRPAAQVHKAPVTGQPVDRAVLAHRGHDDPIAKHDATNAQRAKHIDVGHFPIVLRTGRASMRRSGVGWPNVCWRCNYHVTLLFNAVQNGAYFEDALERKVFSAPPQAMS